MWQHALAGKVAFGVDIYMKPASTRLHDANSLREFALGEEKARGRLPPPPLKPHHLQRGRWGTPAFGVLI